MNIREIDITRQGLDNEYRLCILERVIDEILLKHPTIWGSLDVDSIKQDSLKSLQKKYPNSEIALKKSSIDEK